MISRLLSPRGRVSRSGFWVVNLILLVLVLPVIWLSYDRQTPIWLYVLSVPLVWTEVCLIVKRWHDRGKSGWWGLVILIPFAGLIWAVIELGFMAGTPGANRYGRPTSQPNNFFPLHSPVPSDEYHAHFDDDDLT